MPCYHPTEVPIRRKSIYANRVISDQQVVPCGRCLGCRAEQGRQWAVRMMHESRMHDSNLFVTLTYADEELPENGGLEPKDFTRFIKALRAEGQTFSFFGCGEYGERTARPHYHALLFGADFGDRVDFSGMVWRSRVMESIWGHGRTEIGTVTMASASYVAGYVRKKVTAERYERANPLTGELLPPEFARMSLRPAIGKRWIEKFWPDVYPRDFIVIDGHEAKPPRYYDKFMDREHPILMEEVRQKRYAEAVDLTRYQLMSGEKIHQSRVSLFQGRGAI